MGCLRGSRWQKHNPARHSYDPLSPIIAAIQIMIIPIEPKRRILLGYRPNFHLPCPPSSYPEPPILPAPHPAKLLVGIVAYPDIAPEIARMPHIHAGIAIACDPALEAGPACDGMAVIDPACTSHVLCFRSNCLRS